MTRLVPCATPCGDPRGHGSSLHDALPISKKDVCPPGTFRSVPHALYRNVAGPGGGRRFVDVTREAGIRDIAVERDRKSTRLNSSHSQISYAVFCLKKKKKIITMTSYRAST